MIIHPASRVSQFTRYCHSRRPRHKSAGQEIKGILNLVRIARRNGGKGGQRLHTCCGGNGNSSRAEGKGRVLLQVLVCGIRLRSFAQRFPRALGSFGRRLGDPVGSRVPELAKAISYVLNAVQEAFQPPHVHPIDRILHTIPVPVLVPALVPQRVERSEAACVGVNVLKKSPGLVTEPSRGWFTSETGSLFAPALSGAQDVPNYGYTDTQNNERPTKLSGIHD